MNSHLFTMKEKVFAIGGNLIAWVGKYIADTSSVAPIHELAVAYCTAFCSLATGVYFLVKIIKSIKNKGD